VKSLDNDALTEGDARARAHALEKAVCRALEIEPSDVDIRSAARTYLELSRSILARGPGAATGDLLDQHSSQNLNLVWGLIYGIRTFQVASRILPPLLLHGESVVELGAGWGPAGLVASVRHHHVTLVERSRQRVSLSKAIYGAIDRSASVHQVKVRPELCHKHDLAIFSYSLREIASSAIHAADLVDACLANLNANGRVLILEGGHQNGSRFVTDLRNEWLRRQRPILAPCIYTDSTCPMTGTKDWCHFTWSSALGPVGQRIAAVAGRKSQELHSSWLVLARRELSRKTGQRVLNIRKAGKQGLIVHACSSTGIRRFEVAKKLAKQKPDIGRAAVGSIIQETNVDRLTAPSEWAVLQSI